MKIVEYVNVSSNTITPAILLGLAQNYAVDIDWTASGFAAKTWVSGTRSTKVVDQTGGGGGKMTWQAKALELAGNYIEVCLEASSLTAKTWAAATAGSLVVDQTGGGGGKLTFAFQDAYSGAAAYASLALTAGATAGAEVVAAVTGLGTLASPWVFSIQIETGVSTAAQIKTALDAAPTVVAKISTTVTTAGTISAAVAANFTQGVASKLNLTTGAITISTHGYKMGAIMIATKTGANFPTGLAGATPYYIIVVDANTIKLASSLANARAGTAIIPTTDGSAGSTLTLTPSSLAGNEVVTISGAGTTGSHYLVNVLMNTTVSTAAQIKTAMDGFAAVAALLTTTVNNAGAMTAFVSGALAGFNASALSLVTGAITIASHGYVTGAKIGSAKGGAAAPTGLEDGDFYAIRVDANTIKLASSYANAIAGTGIIPTDDGSDTNTTTLTPAALVSAFKLQSSIDGGVWYDITGATQDLSSTGTKLFDSNSSTNYPKGVGMLRGVVTQADGAGSVLTLNVRALVKG